MVDVHESHNFTLNYITLHTFVLELEYIVSTLLLVLSPLLGVVLKTNMWRQLACLHPFRRYLHLCHQIFYYILVKYVYMYCYWLYSVMIYIRILQECNKISDDINVSIV